MKEEFQKFLDLAKDRNERQSAWYRQLLTLTSAGLALLVGLKPVIPPDGPAKYFLAAAWAFLGLGILFGAAATYSEVSLARRLASGFQKQLLQDLERGDGPSGMKPISANPHKFFSMSKVVMVISLIFAVVSLVTYSILNTLRG